MYCIIGLLIWRQIKVPNVIIKSSVLLTNRVKQYLSPFFPILTSKSTSGDEENGLKSRKCIRENLIVFFFVTEARRIRSALFTRK